MNCSICKRLMKRDREEEGLPLCYVCFMLYNNCKKKALGVGLKKGSQCT